MLKRVRRILTIPIHWFDGILNIYVQDHSRLLLFLIYDNDFWKLRDSCLQKPSPRKELLYFSYLQTYGAWIGLGATFEDIPVFPHSFFGVFISHNAHLGKNITIFQHVTIGSNTIRGSKSAGAPTIGDNVYIGCGAKIIGNCKVGNNVRIGANCVITKDVPDNSVCVMRNLEIISREYVLDNNWRNITEL